MIAERTTASRALWPLVSAVVAVLAGLLGYWWGRQVPPPTTYTLTASVDLGTEGRLPAGTTFYEWNTFGETTHYLVFVEMKERNVLRPSGIRTGVVDPVHAWVPDAQADPNETTKFAAGTDILLLPQERVCTRSNVALTFRRRGYEDVLVGEFRTADAAAVVSLLMDQWPDSSQFTSKPAPSMGGAPKELFFDQWKDGDYSYSVRLQLGDRPTFVFFRFAKGDADSEALAVALATSMHDCSED